MKSNKLLSLPKNLRKEADKLIAQKFSGGTLSDDANDADITDNGIKAKIATMTYGTNTLHFIHRLQDEMSGAMPMKVRSRMCEIDPRLQDFLSAIADGSLPHYYRIVVSYELIHDGRYVPSTIQTDARSTKTYYIEPRGAHRVLEIILNHTTQLKEFYGYKFRASLKEFQPSEPFQ